MYWGFMLKLSTHMWADESAKPQGWYLPKPYNECNRVDLDIWDNTVRFLAENKYNMVLIDVGDGVKYESHPEISAPDAWDKDLLRKKLAEMRALGLEPIPKLNFSTSHDTWLKEYRRMVSSKPYYQVCADLIAEVCDIFKPRFFHLGMDEESPECIKHSEYAVCRQGELYFHDLKYLCDCVSTLGAKPWIWSSPLYDMSELFKKKISKDEIVISPY